MKKIIFFLLVGLVSIGYGQLTDKRDGKRYKTVKIGDQVWMAENLAFKPSSGNYWVYEDDKHIEFYRNNLPKYGYLYDWETAKNVCPTGWLLPSQRQYEVLLKNVPHTKLKSTNGWGEWWHRGDSWNGTNESGFNALPGGWRDVRLKKRYNQNKTKFDTTYFANIGKSGYYWCFSKYKKMESNAENLDYEYAILDNEYAIRDNAGGNYLHIRGNGSEYRDVRSIGLNDSKWGRRGYSVRCIKQESKTERLEREQRELEAKREAERIERELEAKREAERIERERKAKREAERIERERLKKAKYEQTVNLVVKRVKDVDNKYTVLDPLATAALGSDVYKKKKKHLYRAYVKLLNSYTEKFKNAKDNDLKLEMATKTVSLCDKMIELFDLNTKALEKTLKKTESLEEIETLLK
jgi:uncharacterized protein (TIGR02145 family)